MHSSMLTEAEKTRVNVFNCEKKLIKARAEMDMYVRNGGSLNPKRYEIAMARHIHRVERLEENLKNAIALRASLNHESSSFPLSSSSSLKHNATQRPPPPPCVDDDDDDASDNDENDQYFYKKNEGGGLASPTEAYIALRCGPTMTREENRMRQRVLINEQKLAKAQNAVAACEANGSGGHRQQHIALSGLLGRVREKEAHVARAKAGLSTMMTTTNDRANEDGGGNDDDDDDDDDAVACGVRFLNDRGDNNSSALSARAPKEEAAAAIVINRTNLSIAEKKILFAVPTYEKKLLAAQTELENYHKAGSSNPRQRAVVIARLVEKVKAHEGNLAEARRQADVLMAQAHHNQQQQQQRKTHDAFSTMMTPSTSTTLAAKVVATTPPPPSSAPISSSSSANPEVISKQLLRQAKAEREGAAAAAAGGGSENDQNTSSSLPLSPEDMVAKCEAEVRSYESKVAKARHVLEQARNPPMRNTNEKKNEKRLRDATHSVRGMELNLKAAKEKLAAAERACWGAQKT